jgi:hypothetical protein
MDACVHARPVARAGELSGKEAEGKTLDPRYDNVANKIDLSLLTACLPFFRDADELVSHHAQ